MLTKLKTLFLTLIAVLSIVGVGSAQFPSQTGGTYTSICAGFVDTRVVFTDGTGCGQDADFVWNKTTNTLTIIDGGFTLTGITVSSGTAALASWTQTWNANTSINGFKLAYTETLSGSGARYFQILGGPSGVTDEFVVQKGGSVGIAGAPNSETTIRLDVNGGTLVRGTAATSGGSAGILMDISAGKGYIRTVTAASGAHDTIVGSSAIADAVTFGGVNGTGKAVTFGANLPVLFGNKFTQYNNITTAGWGVPSIYGSGRSIAQTTAVASVATYTLGATDGSVEVSANANVTTSTNHSFAVQVDYTDETNTARTLDMNCAKSDGTIVTSITNVTGAGPYSCFPVHLRIKASTAITVKTTGTFTTVTYNVEGNIRQIS